MYLTWLAEAARITGYPVVEVPGWQKRGHGGMAAAEGVVLHHTAGPATGDYPSLGVVRDGRPDLEGPLAHLGLGRTGTIYVIAAGLCWHAGTSRWAGFTSLNSSFVGIEAESTGRGDWTPEQLDAYPRLVAALLGWMHRPADRACAHRECAIPAGRKPDPAGIDMKALRTTVTGYLVHPDTIRHQEDDMAITPDQLRTIVREEIARADPATRKDLGFARDQTLTALGVSDTVNAPTKGAISPVMVLLQQLLALLRPKQ